MRRTIVSAVVLMFVGVILGGMAFRQQVAYASAVLSVLVTNDAAHPVPVREQNFDANANIKVHEQGTANVNVTNSSILVRTPAVTDGSIGSFAQTNGPVPIRICPSPCTATALVITMSSGIERLTLSLSSGGTSAVFNGPAMLGPGTIVVSLPRPITFDTWFCFSEPGFSGTCSLSYVGALP